MLHFFPQLNDWLDELPDPRDPARATYPTRFLAWWGLWLYLAQLGSRRQLDYQLDSRDTHVLDNLGRLAQAEQASRPAHDTLDYFVGRLRPDGLPRLRAQMAQRLCRMRVLDPARLLGHLVLVVDGTGLLCWTRRRCDHCLVQRHEHTALYLHNVLEAELLGPAGVVVSAGREFTDNADGQGRQGQGAAAVKQDCELKAFSRLAPKLKADFPHSRPVPAGDGPFACGRVLQLCRDHGRQYVLSFQAGQLPAAWRDFQALLPLCPKNVLLREQQGGARQGYRWVHDLSYAGDQGRPWQSHAVQCPETSAAGKQTRFAWITPLPVGARNAAEIAWKGGRCRWKIENEGFNRQKNSGLKLGHVYSIGPGKWQAYYYLLQIAFVITQLLERGGLLRQLVAERGRTARQVFGSLANIVQLLRESPAYCQWPQEYFDAQAARSRRIGLDSS